MWWLSLASAFETPQCTFETAPTCSGTLVVVPDGEWPDEECFSVADATGNTSFPDLDASESHTMSLSGQLQLGDVDGELHVSGGTLLVSSDVRIAGRLILHQTTVKSAGGRLYVEAGGTLGLDGVTLDGRTALDVAIFGKPDSVVWMQGGLGKAYQVPGSPGGSIVRTEGIACFSDVAFEQLEAYDGGLAYGEEGSVLEFSSCQVDDVVAFGDGGLVHTRGELWVSGGSYHDVVAWNRGGLVYADGADEVEILDLTFPAADPSIGYASSGGMVYARDVGLLELTGVRVVGLGAWGDGGALHLTDSTTILRDVHVSYGTATRGSAIYQSGGSLDAHDVGLCYGYGGDRVSVVDGGVATFDGLGVDAVSGEVFRGASGASLTLTHGTIRQLAGSVFAGQGSATVERSFLEVDNAPLFGVSFLDTGVHGLTVPPVGALNVLQRVYLTPPFQVTDPVDIANTCPDLRLHPLLTDPAVFGVRGPVPGDGETFLALMPEAWGAWADGSSRWAVDKDGDGWPYAYDCDDGDGEIHPAGIDDCTRGVDKNCDGLVGGSVWLDLDGDGYGGTTRIDVCIAGEDAAFVGGDCDDADAARHPWAEEACDGVDQDCDGAIDEDLPDADMDGVCPGPGMDCDDDRATVAPGLPEIACNGLDDDCDEATPDAPDLDGDGVSDCDDCDPGDPTAWEWVQRYPDEDGDGFGDGSVDLALMCENAGAAEGDDCDDGDASVGAATLVFRDADGDGVGAGAADTRCPEAGWVAVGGDCDDGDDDVGAPSARFPDGDGDGYGDEDALPVDTCPGEGWSAEATDCDDDAEEIHPGAIEDGTDPRDLNCDGFAGNSWVQGGCRGGCAQVGPAPLGLMAWLPWLLLRRRGITARRT